MMALSSSRRTGRPWPERFAAGGRAALVLALGLAALVVSPSLSQSLPEQPSPGLTLAESLEKTLTLQPGLLLEEETIRLNRGVLQEQGGVFDPVLSASGGPSRTDRPLPAGSVDTHERSEVAALELFAQKKFRSGVTFKPILSLSQNEDRYQYATVQNAATVSFNLNVPLLRGRGEIATAGNELAARRAYKASLLQFRQTVSRLAWETVTAYWSYAAASEQVVELRRFESRAEEYIHILQVLIGRGERPGADLPQVAANYESKVSARIEGERVAQDARQKLGLAMGLSYQEGSRLGPTADPLPLAPPQEGPAADLNGLVAQTLTRRGDYLASLETIEGARILLEAEKSGLFPTLDLELSAGYSGLAEGSGFDRWGNSLGQNIPGPSGAVRLTYKWPVDNNQVLGRLQQRFAQFRQSTIASENLSRTIGTAITAALDTAMKTAAETRRLRQSVALYEKALANEQKKVRMGLSTFLDIIVVEDLLGNAIQREISTRLRYAEALVRIRFEAGILVAGEGRQGVIRLEELGARPPAGPGRGAP